MADVIDNAMIRLGVTDPTQQSFIRQLVEREASGNTVDPKTGGIIYGQPINNPKSKHFGQRAMGPLQVMPDTFTGVVRESGLKLDPRNNQDLATAGVWLAMDNLRRANGDYYKAAAAHLGGPAAMNKTIKDSTSGDDTAKYAQAVVDGMRKSGNTPSTRTPAVNPQQLEYQNMVANLMASAEDTGQNPLAAIMAAQQAGALPPLPDFNAAQPVAAVEPSWQQNLRSMIGQTPSTNWIPGVAQQAINELPRPQIDVQRLQEDVDQVQTQRLAQAFGEPAPSNFRVPAAVDRYMDNLLET